MELLIKNGDYVPDGKGGVCRAEGSDALLQRALYKLTVRRGSFPPLPGLGSKLHLLGREKPGDWESLAAQYVAQALADEADLTVTAVSVSPDGDGGASIRAELDYKGERLSLTMGVTG